MSATKRGRGRPPLGAAARDRVVTIRLTASQAAAVESAAAGEERTVADWVRERVLDSVGLLESQ